MCVYWGSNPAVETDTVLESVNDALVHDLLVERMLSSVKVRVDDAGTRKSRLHKKRRVNKVIIGTRHSVVTPEQVADVMGAGVDKAKLLMKGTT